MPFSFNRLMAGFAALTAAVSFALSPASASAYEQGELLAGLYTAPGEFFTVKSPLGPSPILIDGFEATTGAVTFLGEDGQFYGVVCTPNLDVLAGADNDFETDAAILRNWLRNVMVANFFERMLPGTSILREEPVEFGGEAAWVAVIHMPRGSATFRHDPEAGTIREDSWRGVVALIRGGQTYLLMKEVAHAFAGADETFDYSSSGWNDFLPQLAEFYQGMTFQDASVRKGRPQPADRHAETKGDVPL